MPGFTVGRTVTATGVRVSVHGEIDCATRPRIDEAVDTLEPAPGTVHLALDGVPFMDSAGLHLLHDLRSRLQRSGIALTVSGLTAQPLRLLTLAAQVLPGDHWHLLLPGAAPAPEAAAGAAAPEARMP